MSDKKSGRHSDKIKIYAKYSGMAFQLFAMLGLGYLLGSYLDAKMQMSRPLATAVCLLSAVFIYLYYIIRDTRA